VARHFLGLYFLILITLAAVSWGQDKLMQIYGAQETAADRTLEAALQLLQANLAGQPPEMLRQNVADAANHYGLNLEVLATSDITGEDTLRRLNRGGIAHMEAAEGETWTLKQLGRDHVLALKTPAPDTRRGPLDWALTLSFYAVIAMVLMIWIWPLTRDLRVLEIAAGRFGNRNWVFDAKIKPRSPIYPLAETFRKMAARIDSLIASHKDMSNAVSHEIKTPLARMLFEIELAQKTRTGGELDASLDNIKADIAAINELVTATLAYAILERADLALNVSTHDFRAIIPALTEYVRRDSQSELNMSAQVLGDADGVRCDIHLLETVLRNLLYNAVRYARHEVQVTFKANSGVNTLLVDDDGPGIPEQEWVRVLDSFVQLDASNLKRTNAGFGLGLAIVKRTMEWHGGGVVVARSPLGGARIVATWPNGR
jgi:two-component system, OmpR family, sensor kinase